MRILFLALFAFVPNIDALAQPFPGPLPGTSIGSGLPATFQTSAVAWHSRLGRLYLAADEGSLGAMEANGSLVDTWTVGGDLEALAIADPASDFLYVGVEHPDSVREWNLITHQFTRTFDLTPWMQSISDNQGLEGLAFIPDAADPEGGIFLAGMQSDGMLYRFRLPIRSSATSTSVEFLGAFAPIPGRIDLRSVEYDTVNDVVYLGWVDFDRVSRLAQDGTLLADWELPGTKPEGLAVRGCELFVAEDNGTPTVMRYNSFPAVSSCRSIEVDAEHVSLAAGGTVQFSLHVNGSLQAGDSYLLVGSMSGTAPAVPVGLASLPLVLDSYFVLTVIAANSGPFERTKGKFDAAAFASPRIVIPAGSPPSIVGISLHHAWLGAAQGAVFPSAASQAVPLTFQP